jgi:hypothetical protein
LYVHTSTLTVVFVLVTVMLACDDSRKGLELRFKFWKVREAIAH